MAKKAGKQMLSGFFFAHSHTDGAGLIDDFYKDSSLSFTTARAGYQGLVE